MPDRTFAELMEDPTDWFELAAQIVRDHAKELAGQSPQAADATDDPGCGSSRVADHSRTASTQPVGAGSASGCSVIQLDSRREQK